VKSRKSGKKKKERQLEAKSKVRNRKKRARKALGRRAGKAWEETNRKCMRNRRARNAERKKGRTNT
jgi:hypothetical protein